MSFTILNQVIVNRMDGLFGTFPNSGDARVGGRRGRRRHGKELAVERWDEGCMFQARPGLVLAENWARSSTRSAPGKFSGSYDGLPWSLS